MPIESERFTNEFTPPWVKAEHLARFEFACQFVKDKIVVDCACGSGIGSQMFAQASAQKIFAFDLSADAIKSAIANFQQPNIIFQQGDATNLPTPDHSADVYISFETIEHLPDAEKFLQEVKRVLKPDGIFICSTPNRTITNPHTKITDMPWNKFHIQEYTQEEFTDLLKKYFSTIELRGQNKICKTKMALINFIAKLFGARASVRAQQIMKLPRFIFDTKNNHAAIATPPNQAFEYLVAICKV